MADAILTAPRRAEATTAPDTRLSHFICCDQDENTLGPTLCGIPDEPYDGYADEVDCVVCMDLEAVYWCPNHGTCPYGMED